VAVWVGTGRVPEAFGGRSRSFDPLAEAFGGRLGRDRAESGVWRRGLAGCAFERRGCWSGVCYACSFAWLGRPARGASESVHFSCSDHANLR